MYRRIWWMALRWGLWEFPEDWLTTWTVWEMPGRVMRRCIILPTSWWYRVGLGKGLPSLRNFLSSREMSIIFSKSSNKVELFCLLSTMVTNTCLCTINLKSKKVRQIFVFYEEDIPTIFDPTGLIPQAYIKYPRSFTLNVSIRCLLSSSMMIASFH